MHSTEFLLCADATCLDRVSHTELSQQTLMELLVADIQSNPRRQNKSFSAFSDDDGERLDITQWDGLSFDSDGNVDSITWHSTHCLFRQSQRGPVNGTLNMQWVPSTVKEITWNWVNKVPCAFADFHFHDGLEIVRMSNSLLTGELSGKTFPASLRTLSLADNQLSGSFDFRSLPYGLTAFRVPRNALEGTLSMCHLPRGLETLDLVKNKFYGSVSLADFPPRTQTCDLSSNNFSGSVHLENIPASMQTLSLDHNALKGNPYIAMHAIGKYTSVYALAKPLVSLYTNKFEGELVFAGDLANAVVDVSKNSYTSIDWESMKGVESLNVSKNALAGEFSLESVPKGMEELYLSKNALTGSLKLALMPSRMRILKLDGNLFSGTVDLTCISATMAEEGELDLSKNLLEGEIRFGQHIPSEVALSDNAFTSLEIKPEQWREVRFIELRNN